MYGNERHHPFMVERYVLWSIRDEHNFVSGEHEVGIVAHQASDA